MQSPGPSRAGWRSYYLPAWAQRKNSGLITKSHRRRLFWSALVSIFVALCIATGAGWARPSASLNFKKETFSTLCGRLVFLTVKRTQQKLIGLQPCGKAQPYIFDAGPGTLHNFYRFHDVVVQVGPELVTEEFGRLGDYITRFSGYEPIDSCSGCARQAPTRTPIPQRLAEDCGELLLQSAAERFPEVGAVAGPAAAELHAFRTGDELVRLCREDEACQAQAIARRTGAVLGRSAERSAARRDALIELLADTIEDPKAASVCRRLPSLAPFIAVGLSEEGFAVDALAVTSPATHWVEDAHGRIAGLLQSGAPAEEIPASRVLVTGQNKLILLPGNVIARAAARGAGAGQAAIQAALNRTGEVWLAGFDRVLFSPGTEYTLDLSQAPPVLRLVSAGSEQDAAAASFERLPAAGWLSTPTPPPPTATASSTAVPPAATQTSAPTPAPPTPTKASTSTAPSAPQNGTGGPGSICPGGFGFGFLIGALWIARRRQS